VKQSGHILAYQISEIPDPNYGDYVATSDGNATNAIFDSFEHLIRTIGCMPPGSVTIRFVFYYAPHNPENNRQGRLKIFIQACAHQPQYLQSLKLLLEQGSVSSYYNLIPVDRVPTCKVLSSACSIVRNESFIRPLHSKHLNDRIPDHYYIARPFCANLRNDLHNLDRILDKVTEPVVLSIKVTPTDISSEMHQHTQYLALLDSINQTRDFDEIDYQQIDYTDSGQVTPGFRDSRLRPYRKKDPLAHEILSEQRRFHKELIKPHLAYEMTVLANSDSTSQLIASIAAESAFKEGSYRIVSHDALSESLQIKPYIIPFARRGIPKDQYSQYSSFQRMAQVTPVDDFLGAFRLPIGSYFSPLCIRQNTDPPILKTQDIIALGYDQQTNRVSDGSRKIVRGPESEILKQHSFFTGRSGKGKTTANFSMLIQLNKLSIPFCIIETAKTEYRQLKQLAGHADPAISALAKQVEIFTPGNEGVSELRFNPFELLDGIEDDEHIERLLGCFLAAMPVSGPLPALAGEALEVVYDVYTQTGKVPVMRDLVAAVKSVLQSKGYCTQTSSDIMSALEIRLGVLARRIIGRIFSCRESVPSIAHLLSVPSILELDCLPPDQACLLTLFLLTAISEYLRTDKNRSGRLRYVIFIEEAHNIIGKSSEFKASEDIADPKTFATELICRMLAELRALGVGIVIIDQLPSAVAPEVIKNTATKLAFQLVANQDRQELGATMLFTENEYEDIARLRPGQAYFTTEGYHGPRKITTFNLAEKLANHRIPNNSELRAIICKESWFLELTHQRVLCQLDMLQEEIQTWNQLRKNSSSQLKDTLNAYARNRAQDQANTSRLTEIIRKSKRVRNTVLAAYGDLIRQRRLFFRAQDIDLCPQEARDYARTLDNLIKETFPNARDAVVNTADKLIRNCSDLLTKQS